MKQIHLLITTIACAAILFTGCSKDDDDSDDGNQIDRSSKVVSFKATLTDTESKETSFSTSDATFYTSSETEASENVFTGFQKLFNSKTTTSIVGKKGNYTLSITYLGRGSETNGRSYSGSIQTVKNRSSYASSAITNILKGIATSEEEILALEKLDNANYYSALITYKGKEETPGSETFYYSTTATVTVSVYTEKFITGCFSAKLFNAAGDSFTISDGVFNVLGKDN